MCPTRNKTKNPDWEILDEDIELVLEKHGTFYDLDGARALLDCAQIIENLAFYEHVEDKLDSMFSDIEDGLINAGAITPELGQEKYFKLP